jgi:Apea-like HEPN
MTDDDLAKALNETAAADPHTNAGVTAMFALANRVKERPEFAGPLRMVLAGRGAHAFSTEFATQRMLNIVRRGRSAEEAVAWLRKVHETTSGVGGAVKALYGVKCSDRIALSEDVSLIPYSELPPSEIGDWVLKEHERANEARLFHGFRLAPRAVLYRRGTFEAIFVASAADYSKIPPATWFDDLDTAALLLALTPRAVPTEVAHWLSYDDPNVALLGEFGLRRHVEEIRSSSLVAEPTEITPESAAGLLAAYYQLGRDDQRRITLALQRLIRSRSQRDPGNRAIDLAIALEVLFMNADQGEHSYKISLRLARLLGGALAVSRSAFIETRKLYDIRSEMVHSGGAKNDRPVDGVPRSAYDLVEAGDLRCAQAIRKFLDLRRIPDDWRDTELS